MKIDRLLIAALLLMTAGVAAQAQSKEGLQVSEWLEGNFSNKAQAAADPAFADTRIHIRRIWKQRADGFWFYMEQAPAATPNAPSSQRIIHLSELSSGGFDHESFSLPAPGRFVNAWKNPQLLRGLAPDSLVFANGCTMTLGRYTDTYAGGTQGKGCKSDVPGVAYMTSEMSIAKGVITITERGYDAEGKQVWGTTKGEYQFRKE